MPYNWVTCSTPEVRGFVFNLLGEIKEVIKEDFNGLYLHGSLAMGGFNPKSSDIDILVVSNKSLTVKTKRELAKLLLASSNNPFPLELSVLTIKHLRDWKHPCPFDFHYSEWWRAGYEKDLVKGTSHYLNDEIKTDPDLAAHITILNHRGICIEGNPIMEVFPSVPRSDYLSSIMGDFQDCLEGIEEDPIYCTLNLLRVLWYINDDVISSKQEAGNWGIVALPLDVRYTIQKVLKCCESTKSKYDFEKKELLRIRDFIESRVQELLS